MTKINSVSYNKLKQRFRKYLASEGEGSMTYEKQLHEYRTNPPKEKEVEVPEEVEEQEEEDVVQEEEKEEAAEESEEDSESDEEIKAEKAAARAEAKKEAAKAKAGAAEGEEEEYYDEEYDAEEAGSESEGKVEAVDTDEIDPKIKVKYSFLFKERDEMIPEERRWKWVKKDALPEDLGELMDKLSRKKGKKVKATPTEDKKAKEDDESAKDSNAAEFVTTVRTRNDLLIDYTQINNVRLELEILTQERFKGKFNSQFHI